MGTGTSRLPGGPTEALFSGRVIFDAGPLLWRETSDRLAFGATYVRSYDPAIDTGDPTKDRDLAANILGRTLVPIDHERVTQLGGADVTFARGPFVAQTEFLYLHSEATDGTARAEAFGANVDVGYTLPFRPWDAFDLQLAARGEYFDPRFGPRDDQVELFMAGVNAIAGGVRGSIFGTMTFFEDPTTGANQRAGELMLRVSAGF